MRVAPLPIAYVMTHYPRVDLTFIAGELHEIERRGATVAPVAMNSAAPADLKVPGAVAEKERTLYLKDGGIGPLVRAIAGVFFRHPGKTVRLVMSAVRSARLDPKLTVRRLVHVAYGARTWQHCADRGVRHVHAHFGQSPASIAWFAARIGNFGTHGSWTWSFTIHGFQDFVDEADARLDLKAASASFVVCVSDFTKSQLCRVADPQHWDRFHVVRCGIDLQVFTRRPNRPLRDVPRVLVVARLSPEKGHLVLLRAVDQLARRGIGVDVELIGAGPFEEQMRRERERLHLVAHVSFLGELKPAAVHERLADADVFCLPSFSEGLPVSIMEAMAVGVPVVSTHISGIPELAIDGHTALTVPPANPEALATALERMILDAELRQRIVKNARAAVEARHSLPANVGQLADLFAGASSS